MNNFKRLEEDDIDRLPDLPPGIAHNVNNTLGNMRTFGNIVELYLTKLADVVTMMAGGKVDRSIDGGQEGGEPHAPTDPNAPIHRGPSGF